MVIGLIVGAAASMWMARAAHDHTLAAALPEPWATACLSLVIVVVGWVASSSVPRLAAALAGAAAPGAVYGAVMLAGDGERQLAYGWSAIPVTLICLAVGAGLHSAEHPTRPWSARRRSAPRVPRLRTR